MTAPRVSVIVPVFNGERYFGEALDSLRREQEPELEIIVVDDGSTDGSGAIAQATAEQDRRRIVLIQGDHRGVSAARNSGVRAASADYVTFLDSDDICLPGRIARQLQKLISAPNLDAVVGETLWYETLTSDLRPAVGSRYIKTYSATLHSALFRRSLFGAHGLFDEELRYCEDVDFFLRLLEGGARFLVESEIASLYRRHPTNMTRNSHGFRKAMLATFQRSIARRRATGRNAPVDIFFARPFKVEIASAEAAPTQQQEAVASETTFFSTPRLQAASPRLGDLVMASPSVSVIIPVFNGERYLGEALELHKARAEARAGNHRRR